MSKPVSPRMMRRRITTLIVLVFVVAIVVAFASSLSQLNRLEEEYQELLEQQADKDLELAHLQEEYEYSLTDNFIRRMARELLGWVEPGDTKIVDESGE